MLLESLLLFDQNGNRAMHLKHSLNVSCLMNNANDARISLSRRNSSTLNLPT